MTTFMITRYMSSVSQCDNLFLLLESSLFASLALDVYFAILNNAVYCCWYVFFSLYNTITGNVFVCLNNLET